MRARTRERLLLGTLFVVMPLLFVFLVLLPSRRRMEVRKARMEAINQRLRTLPAIQALSAPERQLIQDPQATWKARIPYLKGDADRLAHYHRVVSLLQNAWKLDHVALMSVRASWDGLTGSYSLPQDLGNPALGLPPEGTATAGRLQAWVLDVRVGGTPDHLFQAMEALPRIDPLLEPVGLRWESTPEKTRQSLLLRNLILAP
jgi:hypothetical protein